MDKRAARNSLVLLLGFPLHVLLVTSLDDPGGAFGPAGVITPLMAVLLIALAGVGNLMWILPVFFGRHPGILLRSLTSLVPLPFYVLMFPVDWGLGLAGIACCLGQGHYLLMAHPDETWDSQDSGDGQTIPSASFDLAIRAGVGLLLVCLLACGHHVVSGQIGWIAVWSYAILTLVISLPIEMAANPPSLRGPYLEYVLLAVAAIALTGTGTHRAVLPLLALRQVIGGGRLWHRCRSFDQLWHELTESPARLLVLSFAFAIALGTVVLSLPAATPAGSPSLGVVDALFTATSAVCVTGLIVVDTGTAFSTFGECVILMLIQAGGLGIMTLGMFVALALGRRVGLRSEFALGEMIGEQRQRIAVRLLRFVVTVTIAIELVGAAVLTPAFLNSGMSMPKSLYCAVFHSVSAFCNAGFSLFRDSFQGYAQQPVFPLTLSLLIILGGLGFGVLFTLPSLVDPRHPMRIGTHVRLVLVSTVCLCLLGTAVIWLMDRGHSLAGMPWPHALANAWFQSVTTRTAGFNTVDLTAMSASSDLIMRILMFVGAAPGSTGGGIKITTAAILILLVRARLRGVHHVVVFGRRIEQETVVNAAVLATLGMLAVLAASLLLMATQPLSPSLTPGMLVYEAVSAFATVGLSLGATDQLNVMGKFAIIVLMFIGRVGPLTLLVMMEPRRQSEVDHPSARVMIG